MNNKEEMVLGFAFDKDHNKVALIKKSRPAWQKDKFNGIGGHIEVCETIHDAMVREFEEETGVATSTDNWKCFAKMGGKDWNVWILTTELEDISYIQSKTDEVVGGWYISDVYDESRIAGNSGRIIRNLSWLIPLALNVLDQAEPDFVNIEYK